ncbi:MAG: histidine phosphatase family protein [Burkholderiales bacterium]|jgi:broad specificity phosphatase PhoE|nr:histidine phosphatase family protein [Burkholderiales bacterium]
MPVVLLVRHAQASFGTADYDRLSELGRQQSRWLGEYFATRSLRPHRVMAGTLRRQRDTAIEALGAMGMADTPIVEHAGLNEYPGEALYAAFTQGADPVAHQRRDYRDYWRTFRAGMDAWAGDRLPDMPETWTAFGNRVRAALTAACEGAGRDDTVLVVSSGGAIGRLVADVVGAPSATAIELNLQFRNTGFCELLASRDSLRLLSFNNVPHLDLPERRHAFTFA